MNFLPISAELEQNVAVTLELTFRHNFLAITYFLGICASIIWGLLRPSRAAFLALIGFGLLLFSFEYQKHILEPLKEQTVNSLITIQEHNKVRRILDLSLVKLVPKGSFVAGLASLGTSTFLAFRSLKLSRKNKKESSEI